MLTGQFPGWDPVLLDLPGPLDVRWYGLMYVVAFVVGQVILSRLAKARFLPVPPERVADLVFYCVFGVILGGRLGYALFYDHGLANPLKLVQIWQGGLSFHGGLLGVVVALVVFGRKNGVPLGRVADACALAVTPGILAVRMANFINGELYGRVTSGDTFLAMQFPTDPRALELLGLQGIHDKRDQELAIQYAYRKLEWADVSGELSAKDSLGHDIPWDKIRETLDWEAVRSIPPEAGGVPYRHPSQLYEGFGEGILVGLCLFVVYRLTRKRPLGPGAYGGVFLIGYGVVRFFIEFLRQPDQQFVTADDPIGRPFLGLLTMGQTLCAAMILVGGLMVWHGRRHRRAGPSSDQPSEQASDQPSDQPREQSSGAGQRG